MPANGTLDNSVQYVVDEPATYSDAVASSDDEPTTTTTTPYTSRKPLEPVNGVTRKATFESLPSKQYHEDFIRNCVEVLLKEAVFGGTSRKTSVINYRSPEELMDLFDFKLNHQPSNHEKLLQIVKDTIQYSVKTGHPYFVNQLFSSLDPYGLVGQWLTDALNPSIYTYEVTPVFTLMEDLVLKEMRAIVGFKNGSGDGIFCPGGSMANGYGISCARYKYMPDIKVNIYVFNVVKSTFCLVGIFTGNGIFSIFGNYGAIDKYSLVNCIKWFCTLEQFFLFDN